MSSSANRRPRVAGQRRRPTTVTAPPTPSTPTTPLDTATSTTAPDAGTTSEPAPSDRPRGLLHRRRRDHRTDDAVAPLAGDAAASDTGEVAEGSPTQGAATTASAAAAARARRSLLVPALALVLSLALLAAVLLVTRNDPGERARSAAAATATARSTLEQILSYNHATMAQQIPASQALLTGSFQKEFGETMTKTIVPLAQKDKTVVRARAHEVGVMSQTDDTVTVQAFVNQARTSDTQKEPSIDQNRVIATLTRVGNRWLVSALKAY